MRLNKYLASCGIDSRSKCYELILKKQIKVNGKIVEDFSYRVKENDLVQYKTSIVSPRNDFKFYLIIWGSGKGIINLPLYPFFLKLLIISSLICHESIKA